MSTQNNTCAPRLRFLGFTGEWKEVLVKDICNINTGKSNTQDQVPDGKYPFYIRSAYPVRSNRYLYDCEAVITIGDGQIGKVFHYVNGKFDLHQRCYMMSNFTDVNCRYFYYYFSEHFYERAMRMTAKATVDSVRLEMISEMPILLPPTLAEQQKIAECLAEMDKLIAAQSQNIEALKEKKTGLLQQLFPQVGETIPQLRFQGFDGEWVEKGLDELCCPITPPHKLQSNEYLKEGLYPIVDQSQTFICGWTNDDKGLVTNIPVIVFGDHTCVLKYIDFPFVQGADGVKILSPYEKYNSRFVYQTFLANPVKPDGYKRHFSDFKGMTYMIPSSTDEQNKIAECLSALDNQIAAESAKLEALKDHKKGLMQQLFPQPAN